jgi:hypothetical protein
MATIWEELVCELPGAPLLTWKVIEVLAEAVERRLAAIESTAGDRDPKLLDAIARHAKRLAELEQRISECTPPHDTGLNGMRLDTLRNDLRDWLVDHGKQLDDHTDAREALAERVAAIEAQDCGARCRELESSVTYVGHNVLSAHKRLDTQLGNDRAALRHIHSMYERLDKLEQLAANPQVRVSMPKQGPLPGCSCAECEAKREATRFTDFAAKVGPPPTSAMAAGDAEDDSTDLSDRCTVDEHRPGCRFWGSVQTISDAHRAKVPAEVRALAGVHQTEFRAERLPTAQMATGEPAECLPGCSRPSAHAGPCIAKDAFMGATAPRLVWTKTRPTVDGHYWLRYAGQSRAEVVDVELATERAHQGEVYLVLRELVDAEWAGPIPAPEEE